jgi:hypothetical protein
VVVAVVEIREPLVVLALLSFVTLILLRRQYPLQALPQLQWLAAIVFTNGLAMVQ